MSDMIISISVVLADTKNRYSHGFMSLVLRLPFVININNINRVSYSLEGREH